MSWYVTSVAGEKCMKKFYSKESPVCTKRDWKLVFSYSLDNFLPNTHKCIQ